MAGGKSFTIAKYLILNNVPFLRRYKIIVAAILILMSVFLVLALSYHGKYPAPGGSEFLSALRKLGITKELAVSIISLILVALFIMAVLAGKRVLMEEAEYEILMSQPVDMRSYFLAKNLQELVGNLSSAFYFLVAMLILVPSEDLFRILLLAASTFLLIEYLSLLLGAVIVLKIVLGERYRFVKLGTALYALAGLLHSITMLSVSPILKAPFELPVEAVVYYAAVSESDLSIGVRCAATLVIVVLLMIAMYWLADKVHPEDVKGLRRVGETQARERSLYSEKAQLTVMRQIFTDICSTGHAKLLIIGLVVSFIAGFVVRLLLGEVGIQVQEAGFALSVVVPLVVGEVVMITSSLVLSRDLLALWIYRVYLSDMSPVAEFLVLKQIIYLSEVFLGASLFLVAMTGDFTYILLPAALLPLSSVLSCLTIAVLVLLSSRRKIVREAPTGMYALESFAMSLVLVIVLPTVMTGILLFQLMGDRVLMSIVSLISAIMITAAGIRVVDWVLERGDIPS